MRGENTRVRINLVPNWKNLLFLLLYYAIICASFFLLSPVALRISIVLILIIGSIPVFSFLILFPASHILFDASGVKIEYRLSSIYDNIPWKKIEKICYFEYGDDKKKKELKIIWKGKGRKQIKYFMLNNKTTSKTIESINSLLKRYKKVGIYTYTHKPSEIYRAQIRLNRKMVYGYPEIVALIFMGFFFLIFFGMWWNSRELSDEVYIIISGCSIILIGGGFALLIQKLWNIQGRNFSGEKNN